MVQHDTRFVVRVQSFIRKNGELNSVVVEVSLLPGLPQITFLGLPDAALKESILRIRSALRTQGFQLPQTSQVIVQLWPTHVRKSSQGLDLAVAAALLWETGQLPAPDQDQMPILYGELSLKGEISAPTDIDELPAKEAEGVITGKWSQGLDFTTRQASDLKGLLEADFVCAQQVMRIFKRPEPRLQRLSKTTARLAMLIAAGEHSALMAGPPGSGKSTLAEFVPSLMLPPSESEYREVLKLWKAHGRELNWRPVVQPHHSITPLAMIGGGSALWSGEIARAHGGVLILDELLEFDPRVQEALREPVESGTLSLARAGKLRETPARVLLLATTNLCPCGKFVPKRDQGRCSCTRTRRQRVLQKLSGPFLDRFSILVYTDQWLKEPSETSWSEMRSSVERAVEFRQAKRNQLFSNARVPIEDLETSLDPVLRLQMQTLTTQSKRRRMAVLRVARTLADLESSESIRIVDFNEASQIALESHQALEEWRD